MIPTRETSREGDTVAGPLPFGWNDKRVAVQLSAGGERFEAKLTDDNEVGCAIEMEADEYNPDGRRLFYPWPAVRMIELLEEPDKPAMF